MTKFKLGGIFLLICSLPVLALVGYYFYGYRAEVESQFKHYSRNCYSSTMTAQVTHSTNGSTTFVSTCRSD